MVSDLQDSQHDCTSPILINHLVVIFGLVGFHRVQEFLLINGSGL